MPFFCTGTEGATLERWTSLYSKVPRWSVTAGTSDLRAIWDSL